MRVLYSSNRNPNFLTFTEYIENALTANGCKPLFFENRNFVIPGRIRERIRYLNQLDIRRLNRKLLGEVSRYEPDFFLETGGWNILPETIDALKRKNIITALWTVDAPRIFEQIKAAAPHYDYVFTQGSEAYEILETCNIKNLCWMPFACDADNHKPISVSDEQKEIFGCDVSFVGSGGELYPQRIKYLENMIDFDIGIWGPGWEGLPTGSPLNKFVRGGQTRPDEWTKIYSASKIVFAAHYQDPLGKVPCYQASPRVFEVLASGAFLLVDDQRDVRTLFKDGEHLVIYNTIEDLRAKISYYLTHENERKKIADNGRREVLEKHTYKHRIRAIFDVIGVL